MNTCIKNPFQLPLLLLLILPAAVQAQTYTNNYGIWNYTDNGDHTCTITEYTGSGGAVAVPVTINGLTVTTIGEALYWDGAWVEDLVFANTQVTSVTIPTNVISIEDEAFANCTSLTRIAIPNSVTSIGESAFYNCTSLTNLTIGSGVTSLLAYAFDYCTSLTSVTLSNNYIGVYEFSDCTGLASFAIPNTVTSLGDGAFWGCNSLTNVTIPSSVTSVGQYDFEDCTRLASVTINSSYIGDYEFERCDALTNVMIDNSVTGIGDGAFNGCSRLSSITIPNSITGIGSGAFFDCTRLTSVMIPDSVTSIWSDAFGFCTNLASVTIGNSVTDIGYGAFEECTSLTNLVIGNSVTSIEFSAFDSCTRLANVTLPGSVTTMEEGVFAGCSSLTAISVGANNPAFCSVAGVLFNKSQTTLVEYPGGIAGSYLIPNSVTSIGEEAFDSCDRLTSIAIPNGVAAIGVQAFDGCTGLTNLTLPSSVIDLGDYAFRYCTNLTGVCFEGNVPTINGVGVFESAPVATIYYVMGTTGWGSGFYGLPTAACAYCGGAALNSLQVTITPAAAISAGAQWQVDGGAWRSNGATVFGLSAGSHSVAFSTVSGWRTPTNQIVYLLTNSTVTASGTYVVNSPPQVTTLALPNGTNGLAYSQQLTASNGQLPYSWSLITGALPSALTLATSGLITGTPTASGTFSFTVEVTDAWFATATQALALIVLGPPSATLQPTNHSITVPIGSNVTFSVAVTGAGPFGYQWRLNGTNLPNGIVTTVAGNGTGGYAGDGGAATNAELLFPNGVAVDATGNLFIADTYNNRIRKVGANGIISTVAGNGYGAGGGGGGYSGDGGAATNAELNSPFGVAADVTANLFIVDTYNNRIRKVGTNGMITTVGGNGTGGYSGDGNAATNAELGSPVGVAVGATGNLFISTAGRIRRLGTNGIITTVAGNGSGAYSGDGGAATNAGLNPYGVAVDATGNLFIGDANDNRVREVDSNGMITTVAGNGNGAGTGGRGSYYSGDGGAATNAELNIPQGVAVADATGNLFIADAYNNRIRKVGTNGIITTVAGNGTASFAGDGGAATNAELNGPIGVALDGTGNLFIADSGNNRVRKVVIPGPTLVLNDLGMGNAGGYDVVVSGSYGSVTSSVVNLTVTLPPLLAPQIAGKTNFTFLLSGSAGSNYVLQISTNLANWSSVSTSTMPVSGTMTMSNGISGYNRRFYRVYLK